MSSKDPYSDIKAHYWADLTHINMGLGWLDTSNRG